MSEFTNPSLHLNHDFVSATQVAKVRFISAILNRGLRVSRYVQYLSKVEKPYEVDFGEPSQTWTNGEDSHYFFYEFEEGVIDLSTIGSSIYLYVAADTDDDAQKLIDRVKEAFPEADKNDERKIIANFWHYDPKNGGTMNSRSIDIPYWTEIEGNYATATSETLSRLMEATPADLNGQLVLWHGEPGTGKTYALRALGHQWREKAEFHYIVDPDQFFQKPDYMTDVMLRTTDNDKYKLLVLEDSGEMLTADAKQRVGQGLSRLLNLVDGILGQGLKLMILVTTNEELGSLHPAVARDGRCASLCEFQSMESEQATQWLKDHGVALTRPVGTLSLSELYAKKAEIAKITSSAKKRRAGFVWE